MRDLMSRKITSILSLLILSACSVDTKTGLWENKKEYLMDKQLSSITFDENLSYDEFKENVIFYGKKSKFPKLDD